jgi:methylthioribose-1-phosphate isomerase
MSGIERLPRTIWWEGDSGTGQACVRLVDQRLLPCELHIMTCTTHRELCDAIADMALRGAPALGVGAAFAVALWSENESAQTSCSDYLSALDEVIETVASVRPTAVNLSWGAHQVGEWAHGCAGTLAEVKAGVVELACRLRDDDEARCRAIGMQGARLFSGAREHGGVRIMTHCNAGSLATARYGTATGVIYATHAAGDLAHVWVKETRPVNQGARLTAWEMVQAEVPCSLVCDSTAASLMMAGEVDAVVVGADRICANGDVANKVGTYDLACLAHVHGLPFYVAAPNSTIDPATACGSDVRIEQRPEREMRGFGARGTFDVPPAAHSLLEATADGVRLSSPQGHELSLWRDSDKFVADVWMCTTPAIDVYNPAFDVTPAAFVTGIVTERGVFAPEEVLRSLDD